MANYLNGYLYPQFKIQRIIDNDLIDTINFTLTNSSGMIESLEVLSKRQELLNYTIDEKVDGYRLRWTLPYDEYLKKNNGNNIYKLLKYYQAQDGNGNPVYNIYLIPRVDSPRRRWKVLLEDGFSMGIMSNGSMSIGNRGVILKFITIDVVTDPKYIDPDAIQYTGWVNRFGSSPNFVISGSF